MKKRLIALLLTLVMVVSVLPINVFAAEHEAGKATFDYLFEKYGSLIKDKTGLDVESLKDESTSDKMDALIGAYEQIKEDHPEIIESAPEIDAAVELYETLTDNDNELLSEDALFAIVDKAVESYETEGELTEDAIKEITDEVNTQIESLPAEKKLAVLEEISKTVEKLDKNENGSALIPGGSASEGASNPMAAVSELNKYLAIVRKIVENLRAEGLFTDYADAKFSALTSGLLTKVLNNEKVEPVALLHDAYAMLFNQPGLTLVDNVKIVNVIYETLKAEGLISREIVEKSLIDAHEQLKILVPEYYAEAYAYASENGYIEIAINAIDTAIAAIKSADLSDTQITPESQANIATELVAVVATLEDLKVVLANDKAEDFDGLVKTVLALEDDLYVHLNNLEVFAKQAGENIYEMVYLPLKAIVINEVIPTAKLAVETVLREINYYLVQKVAAVYGIIIDVNNTVENVIDQVRDHIEHITEGEVEITDDTFYLAIVNGEEGYADLVAAALYLTEDQYKKVTAEELTAEDLARATLITVGYNTNSVVTFTADQLLGVANVYVQDAMEFVVAVDAKMEANYANVMKMLGVDIYDTVMGIVNAQAGQYLAMVEGKEAVAIDWEALVGAEYAAYVEAAKAELRAALIENNIPETYVPVTIDIAAAAAQLIAEYTDNLVTVNVEELKAALGEHAVFTLEIPVADLAVFAAESAVYEFIAYNKAYSELVLAINEVNPDATVALLGNYNRFDIDYEIVTEEVSFTLAEVLAELGFEGFKLPEEAKAAIAELAAMGVYEIEIPTDKYVDAVMGEYNKAIDFVVNFEIPAYVAEAELLIADLVEICNAYVERAVDRIADVYTVSIPVADLVNAVVEKGYKLDDLINASLNTEIVIEGRTIEANDVLDLLANLSSIHPFAYTTVFYNMFYVDVADALVGGDEYIAEQIMNGLAAQCIHVYDDECTDTTCNRCGAIREVPGHTPGAEATCTEDQICLVCGEILVKAEGHKPGAEATCTDDQICLVCGEILVKAEGHKPGAAATCTRDQKCTVCGAVLAEAHGHRAGAAATCTTAQTCKVCGLVITPALGHKPGAAATCTTAQTCTVCGAVVAPATGHKAGAAATCTADQKCTVCGEVLAKATGHKAGAAATCTADQKCTVCGEVLAKATGHKWTDATCKAPKTCSVCGATEGSVAAHKFGDWVVTKEAAAGVEGEKTRTCSVCGATETEKIEALPVETIDPTVEPTDPTEPTEPTDPTEPTEPKEGLSTGAIIGISVASVAAVGGAAVAIWFALKKRPF
jgi:hypothetical protein